MRGVSRELTTQPELIFLEEVCSSKHQSDVPGAIRACLQEGLVDYAYLRALRIHGLNMLPLDAPPTHMCLLQGPALVEGNPELQRLLYETGFRTIEARVMVPVVDVERRSASFEEEAPRRIETDAVFAIAMKGRASKLVYVYLVYCLEYYKMKLPGRHLTFVAVPVPPAVYPLVKNVVAERCGFTDG